MRPLQAAGRLPKLQTLSLSQQPHSWAFTRGMKRHVPNSFICNTPSPYHLASGRQSVLCMYSRILLWEKQNELWLRATATRCTRDGSHSTLPSARSQTLFLQILENTNLKGQRAHEWLTEARKGSGVRKSCWHHVTKTCALEPEFYRM